jgi:hypothetical protein
VEVNNEEMITITKAEYDELQDDATLLNCLRNAGVDNWDGWDFAIEEYQELTGE